MKEVGDWYRLVRTGSIVERYYMTAACTPFTSTSPIAAATLPTGVATIDCVSTMNEETFL